MLSAREAAAHVIIRSMPILQIVTECKGCARTLVVHIDSLGSRCCADGLAVPVETVLCILLDPHDMRVLVGDKKWHQHCGVGSNSAGSKDAGATPASFEISSGP